jgi:hypothetical protein
MYNTALHIIESEGFPPKTKDGLPCLTDGQLVMLSAKTKISVPKLAFYFSDMRG